MLASVNECVKIIESHLRALQRSVVSRLQQGLSAESVVSSLKLCGLDAPDDLVALYACHDGTRVAEGDPLDDAHFFPGFYWLSLNDALNAYRAISQDIRWSKSWVPIFSNGGGDFYAVVCDESSAEFGSVVGFILGEIVHSVEFQSVFTMLKTMAECYERDIYFLEDGYLEARDFEATQVAKSLNPDLSYYKN